MASALLDASAMVAMFGDHEPHTAHYHALLREAAQQRWHVSTTWPCVVEASHLLGPRHRHGMLRWIARGAVAVFPFAQEALDDFVTLTERYTEPPRTEMDLADAPLVWQAVETGVTTIRTTDVCDFARYRHADGRVFEIL